MAASESTTVQFYEINVNGENMVIKTGANWLGYYAYLYDQSLEQVGQFTIEGKPGYTMDMGISIDDEYKGKGLSRCLINALCNYAKSTMVDGTRLIPKQHLYIDTDASWEENTQGKLVSFWDKMGMEENPLYEVKRPTMVARRSEGAGYEKVITFGKLEQFGKGCKIPLTEVGEEKYPSLKGGKKKKTKKLRKSKSKSNTKKKSKSKKSKRSKSKRSKSKKSKRRM